MALKKKRSHGSTGKSTSTKHSSGRKKSTSSRRYSPSSQEEVRKEMHDMKRGKAHSGRSGKLVKSRKQAIAIGLSKARKKGAKVPAKK